MKQKVLLSCILSLPVLGFAQERTAYAITAGQKGQNNWCEVRVVNLNTGEEVQSVYKPSQDVKRLNARTGKAIALTDAANARSVDQPVTYTTTSYENGQKRTITYVDRGSVAVKSDMPFATNSAACAYDKKHERLYYTPMGINQLRYIDLKSKTPTVYYFENEPFGVLAGRHDVQNQITRMVIASDGNGYALTNNGNHLLQFTTGKKPVITDLGSLTDAPGNAASVHSNGGYGGDMIADANGNLYLITANRAVFKIPLQTKEASFQGIIQGLPRGYTTNGAVVEEGSKVIVSSSNSTQGYYRFDLISLQSELVSSGSVYNASDLANGTLAFEKKKKKRDEPKEEQILEQPVKEETVGQKPKPAQEDVIARNGIAIFPNPVTTGLVKVSFGNQPQGKYRIQLMDISGKLVSEREVIVTSAMQIEEFRLPELVTKGSYMMKVVGETNKVSFTNKIIVQ
jgi:Secretion system C-terminal sorting domain